MVSGNRNTALTPDRQTDRYNAKKFEIQDSSIISKIDNVAKSQQSEISITHYCNTSVSASQYNISLYAATV